MNATSRHWIRNNTQVGEQKVRPKIRAFLALAVLLLAGCGGKKFVAPPLAEVKSIEAWLSGPPSESATIIQVPSFLHESVLSVFNGATRDSGEIKWAIMGSLRIVTTTGTLDIELFQTGEERGVFKIGKDYYRGRNDAVIKGLLLTARKLQSEETAGGQAPTSVPEK